MDAERIREVIAAAVDVPMGDIPDGKRLCDIEYPAVACQVLDVADEVIHAVCCLEDEFGISLDDDTVESWGTIGDVIRSVQEAGLPLGHEGIEVVE